MINIGPPAFQCMTRGQRTNKAYSARSTPRENSGALWPSVIASWRNYPAQLTLASKWVGGKAFGLFQLPEAWVPRFVVLTPAFQERFKLTGNALRTLRQLNDEERDLIQEFLRTASADGVIPRHFLIRSNSVSEDLLLRGAFKSYPVEPTEEAIAEGIAAVLNGSVNETMCVILQAAIEPGLPGHMSNERRITPDIKRWLIEGMAPSAMELHQQFVRAGNPGRTEPLFARTEKDVSAALRRVAGMAPSAMELHQQFVRAGN